MKTKKLTICIVFLVLIFNVDCVEKDYTDFVKHLQQKITENPFKGEAYIKLAYLTDTYGPRMWGSDVLEAVIQQMKMYATDEGFQNIGLQTVSNFTKWIRGKQELILHSPRPIPTILSLTALGGSVSGDIKAQVLVVNSFDELETRKSEALGKIVLFNHEWIDYQTSVPYRVDGPSIAAKYGAKAMLVRSIASESIYSVHTGYMSYDPLYEKIPCAAITVEDSEMFRRMQDRGQVVTVQLIIETQFVPNTNSANLIFEIIGTEKPQQIILAGGHIDTWDTGSQTGANDDGGGLITVFEAFRMLKRLGFRPRRTMRFIAWSGQESGSPRDGSAQYLERHFNEINRHVAAFQNDEGSSRLIGFGHSGPGRTIVQNILAKYMSIIGAQKYSDDGWSADVQNLLDHGVPIIHQSIIDNPTNDFYYKYHHTAGDSMTIMDSDDMDSNVLGIASFLFIIADLQNSLREVNYDEPSKQGNMKMLRKFND